MKNRIFLIHGFNVTDEGKGSIGKLRPLLEKAGYIVEDFSYGFLGLLMVRLRTNFIAKMLNMITDDDDCIIAHSHGCAITAKSMEQGAKFDKVVFIHPALNAKWKIPSKDSVNHITVYYSEKDVATWAAKLLRLFSPSKLFFKTHFWGAMGSTGPVTSDIRWTSINDGHSHSGIFKDLKRWGDSILRSLER